jgi:hypothetical protein
VIMTMAELSGSSGGLCELASQTKTTPFDFTVTKREEDSPDLLSTAEPIIVSSGLCLNTRVNSFGLLQYPSHV